MKILNPTDNSEAQYNSNPQISSHELNVDNKEELQKAAENQPTKEINISSDNLGDIAKLNQTANTSTAQKIEKSEYTKNVEQAFSEINAMYQDEARKTRQSAPVDLDPDINLDDYVDKDYIINTIKGKSKTDKKIKISQEQKDKFCTSLIDNSRYTEVFELLGGKLNIEIRSRTLEETQAIEDYLRYIVSTGQVSELPAYTALAQRILLTAQVSKINNVTYETLKSPLYQVETKDGRSDPGWLEQTKLWLKKSDAVSAMIIQCIIEFEARYWFMVVNAHDTNFWLHGESTVE